MAQQLDFSTILLHLKAGGRARRGGWNGKGLWLWLVPQWDVVNYPMNLPIPGGDCLPFIGMRTAQEDFVPWLASQTDILANDWEVVPEGEA
jgi:hypothetical protein